MDKKYFRGQDLVITILLLILAGIISQILLPNTGAENNSALIFVAAVVLISRLTEGYFYGIFASIVGVFCINYFFMYPYAEFNFSLSGYTVAMVSMLVPALIVCVLTTQLKRHAHLAQEREQQTRELYEINTRLQQEKNDFELASAKAAIRSNILLAVSHDLRTPLTAISGSASYLHSHLHDMISSDDGKLLLDIKEDAEWLTVMVENILSVTRLRDTGEHLQLSEEVPDEIIGSSISKIQRRFPDAKIRCDLSDEVLLVLMDPLLIQQVLINLLENAIRHSDTADDIVVSVQKADDLVRFLVTDHGKGLPEEILRQIREEQPVVVERRGDSYRGIGIGLSVCQSILKAHHSRLSADSDAAGTCFYFDLEKADGKGERDEIENTDC